MMVQSPKMGCSHLRSRVDKHLATMREKAAAIPDDEFQTMVKAILVNIEEKDKNLAEENARLFTIEIGIHRYQFDYSTRLAEAARSTTKAEWQAFYETLMHTSRRRLDMRYNSETHKEEESNPEFAFPEEKKWDSQAAFVAGMELSADATKNRYCAADFKM